MKKNLLLSLIGILLFAAGYQLSNLLHRPVPCEQIVIEDNEDQYDDYEAHISDRYEGMTLPCDSIFVQNYRGDNIPLSQLAGPKKLIARFSSTGCRPCIDALTSSLQDFAARNPEWQVAIVMRDVPLRDLHVMAAEFGPGFTFLYADRLPMDFNFCETPVVFQIIDNKIFGHFTCRYGDTARTAEYINSLTKQV